MTLSGKQSKSLVAALLDAFPKRSDLEQLVRYELDEKLDKLVANNDMQTVHFHLIEWAESQGKLTDLLDSAKRQNPGNERLREWLVENDDSIQSGASLGPPSSSKLQQTDRTSVPKPSVTIQTLEEYRVLVVENDLDYRKIHSKDISDWGWVPIIAEGMGEALLDDARQKLRNCKCHSAIVDMRLLDNENPQDMSGLKLVKEMASIPCIVVTGKGDYDVARRAGTEFGVFRIIQKIEDPEKTKEALNEAFEIWSDNKPELVPSDWIENVIRKRLFNQARENAPVEETRCLLNLLFPNADRLRAETMSRAPSSSSSVQREKSFVFRATPDNLQPRVVKLAPLVDIKADVENYQQYVEEQLPGALHAQLKSHAMAWGIGGTSYSFVGDVAGSIQRFDQFYSANNDIESIKNPLNCFFREVWDVHYRRCEATTNSVFESYNQLWKNIFDDESPKWGMEQKDIVFNTITAPNPKRWIADNYKFAPADIEECVVHGDMHAGNLLVNETQAWTIDFERTGPAHKLADFVELEKDVIVRLADINSADIDSVFNVLIATLTMPMRLNQLNIESALIKQNDEVRKALLTVQYLRSTAEQLFGNVDMREYYWGLLLNMMYTLCKLQDGLNELERTKTLRYAGVLCQRLKEWGKADWLPESWPSIE